jgi:F-type H+-transporting ATPase subunit delta
MLLVDKRRIQFLEPVCQQYLTLARALTNTVLAEVSSATELNDSQKQIVIDKVKTLTGANVVELKTKVDGSLIGGVVIKSVLRSLMPAFAVNYNASASPCAKVI